MNMARTKRGQCDRKKESNAEKEASLTVLHSMPDCQKTESIILRIKRNQLEIREGLSATTLSCIAESSQIEIIQEQTSIDRALRQYDEIRSGRINCVDIKDLSRLDETL